MVPVKSLRVVDGEFGIGDNTGPENLWTADTKHKYATFTYFPYAMVEVDKSEPVYGMALYSGWEERIPEDIHVFWQLIGTDDRESWFVIAEGDKRILEEVSGHWGAVRFTHPVSNRYYQFQFRYEHEGTDLLIAKMSAVILLTSGDRNETIYREN